MAMRPVSRLLKRSMLGGVLSVFITSSIIIPAPLAEYSAWAKRTPRDRYSDNCAALRKPFESIKNEQLGRTIIGTILGAGLGALVGSQIKKEETVYDQYGRPHKVKRGNHAVEGAVAGAVVGGLGGYLTSIEQHRQNQAELQKALDRRNAERAQYSELGQKLADLGNCRNEQIFSVRAQFEAGQLSGEVANARLDKIQQWIAKDDSIIDKAAGMDAESVTRYAQAVAVADGEAAQVAEQRGSDMVDRYRRNADRYEGSVSVTYDSSRATVSPETQVSTSKAFVTASRGANVRETPSTQGRVIGSLGYREQVEVSPADVQGWSKLSYQGRDGYVADSLLSDDRPAARPAARASAAPRPDIAPGKIEVRSRTAAPRTRQGAVTKAIAESQTFKAVDAARRNSNQQQLSMSRNRIAAALQAAKS